MLGGILVKKLSFPRQHFLSHLNRFRPLTSFSAKHIGNQPEQIKEMLQKVKVDKISQLVDEVVPKEIIFPNATTFPETGEVDATVQLKQILAKNVVKKNLIGLDFNDTILPPIIQRKVLENPKWYTAYTPYQSEISQGRLEAQFNFQTLITELTGLEVSNISLLDSGSAASEVLNMSYNITKGKRKTFFCSNRIHPVILDILKTRAQVLGIHLIIDDPERVTVNSDLFGFMFSYPDRYGTIEQHQKLLETLQKNKTIISCHTNLMSLLLLKSPGELGVDISFGTAQSFGIPLWFGGPHPAFLATRKKYIRLVPGRIVGKSVDAENNSCYRIALQTREQHIRKEKATSNICTSQALLSVVASMYAIYHGKENLIAIARQINNRALLLTKELLDQPIEVRSFQTFDTVTFYHKQVDEIVEKLDTAGYSSRKNPDGSLSLVINEAISETDIKNISQIILNQIGPDWKNTNLSQYSVNYIDNLHFREQLSLPMELRRYDDFLSQPIFNHLKTETDFLRYLQGLENKDYTLTEGMIPLGSCTMKLNAVSELLPLSYASVQNIHPYTPIQNAKGYLEMIEGLTEMLTNLIGLDYISYQSNSGAMGEYSGLLSIRAYHQQRGDHNRNICLIPGSAHGTNFASASLASFKIEKYDDSASLDEFRDQILKHRDNLGCLMVTYPNTYGVFDPNIIEVCQLIHEAGGLVYMDGANMNAQVGITSPGECGADVCHLNLHKTFCIPHGGGGPGMGPILVNEKLRPFLPSNVLSSPEMDNQSFGALTLSQYSSASILSITYQYLKMMGSDHLRRATEMAILNANYLKESLKDDYTIYTANEKGRIGHEFIISLDEFSHLNIRDVDIAKRLIDYSFHPPTMSWPIPNSLMIEPTESESKLELDRFIRAMKNIRVEIKELEEGLYSLEDNVLKNAPHSMRSLKAWEKPYAIEKGCFPLPELEVQKFWPSVCRVNDVYGDKNLVVK